MVGLSQAAIDAAVGRGPALNTASMLWALRSWIVCPQPTMVPKGKGVLPQLAVGPPMTLVF